MRLKEREVVKTVRRLQLRDLRLWVRKGWVKPSPSVNGPLFDELDIARIRLICDLRKDLALPSESLPMILALIDQIHGLRRELRTIANAVGRLPPETRLEMSKALRETARAGKP